MVNRLTITGWTAEEKEAYNQLDDCRLSEFYSKEGIGKDPELREDYLLGHFEMDKLRHYNIVGSSFSNLGTPFKAICLSFLEGMAIFDIEGKEEIANARNN